MSPYQPKVELIKLKAVNHQPISSNQFDSYHLQNFRKKKNPRQKSKIKLRPEFRHDILTNLKTHLTTGKIIY